MRGVVLIVDDDVSVAQTLERMVRECGYQAEVVTAGAKALERLSAQTFEILLVDLIMPEVDGFAVLRHAVQKKLCQHVIVITGQSSVPVAVEAMRAGAADFITKPFVLKDVRESIERVAGASEKTSKKQQSELSQWRRKFAPELLGQEPALMEVLSIVQRVADTDCNVLVQGESGTGKELVAHAIHNASRRSQAAFVPLNCAAIPKELMESEIFGHTKGAFSGATEKRVGKFQVADGGTLFLDELGEMELSLQSKFLRVIQEGEFTPVGESKPQHADVRIVSATNVDLENSCKEGKFRADLYYRLNVIPIRLPSLRERPGDIPLLVERIVERANRRHGRNVSGFQTAALDVLKSYKWPGNIRELANLVERLVVIKGEGEISIEDLPTNIKKASPSTSVAVESLQLPGEGLNIDAALQSLETRLTLDALRRSNGNKAKAAELLGLKRTTLVERLRKLNIETE